MIYAKWTRLVDYQKSYNILHPHNFCSTIIFKELTSKFTALKFSTDLHGKCLTFSSISSLCVIPLEVLSVNKYEKHFLCSFRKFQFTSFFSSMGHKKEKRRRKKSSREIVSQAITFVITIINNAIEMSSLTSQNV